MSIKINIDFVGSTLPAVSVVLNSSVLIPSTENVKGPIYLVHEMPGYRYEIDATPESISMASRVTKTGALYQSAELGNLSRLALVTGDVLSIQNAVILYM